MQRLDSHYRAVMPVAFPPFAGRRHYMHGFDPAAPSMPEGLEDYLPMVSDLCNALGVSETTFVTVDEKITGGGQSQRRPGPHVDGCFIPEMGRWGHGGGGGWNHYCNHVPTARMPVVVAASVAGCKAWEGLFEGEPRNNGDLSHLTLGEGEILPANVAYVLSPDCIHESMVLNAPTPRSFIRLALPVGTVVR